MFCSSCGERSGWRCSKCGRISDRSWLLAVGAVSWFVGLATTFLYLWRLLPTVAALFSGMRLELLPLTEWHVRLTTGWMALVLFLSPIVLVFFAWRGSRKAVLSLAASGVLMIALSFTGIMSTLLSIVTDYPSAMDFVSDHLRLSEGGSIALLTGDAPRSVILFRRLHGLRTDPGSPRSNSCWASSASSAFLLAEAYRRSGDEPRAMETYRSVKELTREDCIRTTEEGKELDEAARLRIETPQKTP